MNFRRSVVVWLSEFYVFCNFFRYSYSGKKVEIFLIKSIYFIDNQYNIYIFKVEIRYSYGGILKNFAIFKRINS